MSSIADAVVAAVKAAVPGRPVFDALVPTVNPDPDGYVVVYCDEGQTDRPAVDAAADAKTVGWQVSSFGPDRQRSGWLSRHVTDYLLANDISVSGWTAGVVSHDHTRAPTVDESVKEYTVVMGVDQFSMVLSRAS